MTVFRTVAEIGAAITDAQARVSGMEFIRQLDSWRLELAWTYTHDPLSDEYHSAVLRHYEEISGRPYASPAANESFAVPKSAHLPAPFPHCTADAEEVSRYLFGVANIIRAIPNRPPARIVEFGAGWGHVAMHLARMGHDVTAVDINSDSAELLRERASRNEVRLAIRNAGFLDVDFDAGAIEVGIFFESFHHCHRPFDLLDRLERWIAPAGLLLFAAEPIYCNFHAPWDVRLDGQSIWATREHGWLELGFDESFFVRTLMQRGWVLRKRTLDAAGAYGVIYLATRHAGEFVPGETFFPPDSAATWASHGDSVPFPYRWTSGASRLPLDSRPQWRQATVKLSNFNPRRSLRVDISCGSHRASRTITPGETADLSVRLPESGPRELRIDSPKWVPQAEGVNDDTRTLGIAVGRIRYDEHCEERMVAMKDEKNSGDFFSSKLTPDELRRILDRVEENVVFRRVIGDQRRIVREIDDSLSSLTSTILSETDRALCFLRDYRAPVFTPRRRGWRNFVAFIINWFLRLLGRKQIVYNEQVIDILGKNHQLYSIMIRHFDDQARRVAEVQRGLEEQQDALKGRQEGLERQQRGLEEQERGLRERQGNVEGRQGALEEGQGGLEQR